MCLNDVVPIETIVRVAARYQGWTSTLYNCLDSVNVTEDEAAWLGFSMTMSGCLGSIVVGAILDRFLGYLKLVTEVLMIIAMVIAQQLKNYSAAMCNTMH